jgi:hypothetical protein
VPDDGHVALDVWITIEKLVSPAEDKDSGKQKDYHGESESDAQRCKARRFNPRYQRSYLVSNRVHFDPRSVVRTQSSCFSPTTMMVSGA